MKIPEECLYKLKLIITHDTYHDFFQNKDAFTSVILGDPEPDQSDGSGGALKLEMVGSPQGPPSKKRRIISGPAPPPAPGSPPNSPGTPSSPDPFTLPVSPYQSESRE